MRAHSSNIYSWQKQTSQKTCNVLLLLYNTMERTENTETKESDFYRKDWPSTDHEFTSILL